MRHQNKYFLALALTGTLFSCGGGEQSATENFDDYQKTAQAVVGDKAPEKASAERTALLEQIEANELYKTLVTEKVVTAEYLPLVENLGYSLGSLRTNGKYELTRDFKRKGNKEHVKFCELVASLHGCGGFSSDILEIFDRYKTKYGLYQTEEKVVGDEKVEPFNLLYAFGALNSKNEDLLEELVHARGKEIMKSSRKDDLLYPHLWQQDALNDQLGKVNKDSELHYEMAIDSKDLYKAYEENEVSADNKMKGKRIAVTGRLQGVSKDMMGKPYAILKSGDFFGEVNCYLPNDKKTSSLKKGEKLTLVGTCEGINSVTETVSVENCLIY